MNAKDKARNRLVESVIVSFLDATPTKAYTYGTIWRKTGSRLFVDPQITADETRLALRRLLYHGLVYSWVDGSSGWYHRRWYCSLEVGQ